MKTVKLYSIILLALLVMNDNSFSQDWANLNKFKNDNSKITATVGDENRIVFIGNSITEGWSEFYPEFFEGKPYIERGISGQTTPQMLLRFRQDVINLNPRLVVILAGTNDIAGNTGPMSLEMILDNIKSMCELAEANGIKIILCSVLPAYDYPWSQGKEPNIKIPILNKMIKEYADKKAYYYLDYFKEMADERNGLNSELTNDGVHPNKNGYKVMERIFNKMINSILDEQ